MVTFREKLSELYKKFQKNNDFFEKIGITRDGFRKLYAENSNPRLNTILKIAEFANISPAWFFGVDTELLNTNQEVVQNELTYLKMQNETLRRENQKVCELNDQLLNVNKNLNETINSLRETIQVINKVNGNAGVAETKKTNTTATNTPATTTTSI